MSTTNSPVELVCFDLGRVLIEICRDYRDACDQVGLAAPACVDDPQVRQAMQSAFFAHETGRIDDRVFASQVAAVVGMAADDVHRVVAAWLKRPFPGVAELLDELRRHDAVQLACLSNTNALHWSMMCADVGQCALPLNRLDHHFASHLIGVMKPDEQIYVHVEQAVGIAPERIVFFDDLPDNVQAARRRGWQAHRILPDPDPVTQMRTHLHACGLLT